MFNLVLHPSYGGVHEFLIIAPSWNPPAVRGYTVQLEEEAKPVACMIREASIIQWDDSDAIRLL